MPTQRSAELAVFISHSTKDEPLANSIAGLLQSALPLAPGQIRCSSVEGHCFQWGSQLDSAIRKELNDAPVFIVLVTESSMQSTYVVFESGARWGLGKAVLPLLPSRDYTSLMGGPLSSITGRYCDSAADMHDVVTHCAKRLWIDAHAPSAYQESVGRVVQLANAMQREAPLKHEPNASEEAPLSEGEARLVCALLGNEPIESKEVAEVLVVETNRAFLYLERLREKGLVDFEGHVGGPSVPVTLTEEGRRFASDHILREAGKSVTQMLLEKLEASALGILLQEIYKDVMASPSIREILVLSNNRVPFEHAKPCFVYYMDDHPNLRFHFDILTNHGLIVVVKGDDPTAPIYRINEHFVATVLAEHDASKPLERGPS